MKLLEKIAGGVDSLFSAFLVTSTARFLSSWAQVASAALSCQCASSLDEPSRGGDLILRGQPAVVVGAALMFPSVRPDCVLGSTPVAPDPPDTPPSRPSVSAPARGKLSLLVCGGGGGGFQSGEGDGSTKTVLGEERSGTTPQHHGDFRRSRTALRGRLALW